MHDDRLGNTCHARCKEADVFCNDKELSDAWLIKKFVLQYVRHGRGMLRNQ